MAEEIDRFIPAREAEQIIGRKRCWMWRQAKAGTFPAPIHVGGRNFWKLSELRAWMAAQEERSRAEAALPMKEGLRRYREAVERGLVAPTPKRRRRSRGAIVPSLA